MGKKETLPVEGQITRFYHRTTFKFAPALFEEDCRELEKNGWRLVFAANLGTSGPSDSPIVAIYQK